MVPYIHTTDGISVVLKNKPYHAAKDDKIYGEVLSEIQKGGEELVLLAIFDRAAAKIKAATRLTSNMEYSGGVVLYKGEVLANYAVDKLIGLLEAGQDHTPIVNFVENLMKNPSKRVVDDLYRFLEKGKLPITPDGHFLAYKKVRSSGMDIHSGRFANLIGSKLEMQRNHVDEDSSRTCSSGFHVCSYDYLPQFAGGAGEKVMVCKINPADVVAIPADYNDTKMRVCKYEVTDEVTDYYKKQDNVLTKSSVSEAQRDFVVYYEDSNASGIEEYERYWTPEEATKIADEFNRDNDVDAVWVEKVSDGSTVYAV